MPLRLIAALIIAGNLLATEAPGGAWTLSEGEGQVIMTTTREASPAGALIGRAAGTESNVSQIFAEYGLDDGLTVGLVVYGEFSTVADQVETRIGGHLRHRVWQGAAGDVLSLQAGVSFPVERWLGNGLGDDRPQSASEVDLRALYGRGWQSDWGNSFISSELGLRIRGERLDEEVRFDFTAGHEPFRGFLGLMSVFASVPLGHRSDPSLKLAPSIAVTLWPWLGDNDKKPYGPINPNTVQIGVSWDALNPDDGLAVSLSVWKRF